MDMVNLFDYATLKVIWWLFIGALLIGFAIMDGHDMGIGTLLPFVAKTDEERRIVINSVGVHWEGNQTWLITGAGAIFAAWPMVYATAFSGFYWAMLAVLWAMFFRPVGFKYRSMIQNETWRKTWDWCLFIGSFVPALLFGVALGNVIQGVPFHFDDTMRSFYTGSFWALLNPFALLCGAVSVAILVPPTDRPTGWDVADAVEEGFEVQAFLNEGERRIVKAAPSLLQIGRAHV